MFNITVLSSVFSVKTIAFNHHTEHNIDHIKRIGNANKPYFFYNYDDEIKKFEEDLEFKKAIENATGKMLRFNDQRKKQQPKKVEEKRYLSGTYLSEMLKKSEKKTPKNKEKIDKTEEKIVYNISIENRFAALADDKAFINLNFQNLKGPSNPSAKLSQISKHKNKTNIEKISAKGEIGR